MAVQGHGDVVRTTAEDETLEAAGGDLVGPHRVAVGDGVTWDDGEGGGQVTERRTDDAVAVTVWDVEERLVRPLPAVEDVGAAEVFRKLGPLGALHVFTDEGASEVLVDYRDLTKQPVGAGVETNVPGGDFDTRPPAVVF